MSEDIKSIFEVPPRPPPKKPTFWRTQAKYFAHGLLWWLANLIGLFILPLLAILVLLGFIIGLIIGFIILLLFVGFINWTISGFLWFEMKEMTFWGLLGQGLLLSILLLIVDGLTVLLPIIATNSNVYVIVATFIWGCYVNGYLGKFAAAGWRHHRTTYQENNVPYFDN